MDKIGSNDPCYCGSGRKYKKCCGSVRSTKNNELSNITFYGSEFFDKETLDKFNKFYIETTDNELFEISKNLNRYKLKDITPPVMEKIIDDYGTIRLNDIQFKKLTKPNPKYEHRGIGEHEESLGIVKGGHFSWTDDNNYNTCTKGTINKLYVKQDIEDTTLNISLFPPDTAFKSIDDYLDKDFKITTVSNTYLFSRHEDGIYFENKKVVSVFSLYDMDNPYNLESPNLLFKEYNVCYDIVLNKPFMILTIKNDYMINISLINSKVLDISLCNI